MNVSVWFMYDLLSLEKTEPFDQGGLPALWRPARRYLRLIEGISNYSVAILIQALIVQTEHETVFRLFQLHEEVVLFTFV